MDASLRQPREDLLRQAAEVLEDTSLSAVCLWSPVAGVNSVFNTFRPYSTSELCDDAVTGDDDFFECGDGDFFASNSEYSLVWELYGMGSGGMGIFQDGVWQGWLSDPSLSSIGYNLARLDCVTPVTELARVRFSSLAKCAQELNGMAAACPSQLVARVPTDGLLLNSLEKMVCVDVSDAMAMMWQACGCYITVVKVSSANVNLMA
jgi:hypothetical protein